MVSDISIETELKIPFDLLWKARSASGFLNFMVKSGALNRMEATPVETVQGSIKTRKQIYVPKTIEIPAMVKSVFDDTYLEITDTQEWDEKIPYETKYSITPGVLTDYITMSGVLQMKPSATIGDQGCRQIITGTCQVDIPFVGWYVEQAIIMNMNTFYETYPQHIEGFVNMLMTTYGDGTRESLRSAFDRMQAEPSVDKDSQPGTKESSPKGTTSTPVAVGDTSDQLATNTQVDGF